MRTKSIRGSVLSASSLSRFLIAGFRRLASVLGLSCSLKYSRQLSHRSLVPRSDGSILNPIKRARSTHSVVACHVVFQHSNGTATDLTSHPEQLSSQVPETRPRYSVGNIAVLPRRTRSFTALTVAAGVCPAIAAVSPIQKSAYVIPSTSVEESALHSLSSSWRSNLAEPE